MKDFMENFALQSHPTLTEFVADALKRTILEGNYPQGSQIPTEHELVSQLEVSRTTVREAMRMLEEDGLIVRKRGLGTFVSERAIIKDLTQNTGITEMIEQSGRTSGSEDVRVEQAKASKKTAAALSIEKGDPVFLVERVRSANDTPVVWTFDFIPINILGEKGLKNFDSKKDSLYRFFKNELGISIVRGTANLYPIEATKEIIEKLNVAVGTPILEITQTDFDNNDRAVLHSIEYHIPDSIRFFVYRKGPHRF